MRAQLRNLCKAGLHAAGGHLCPLESKRLCEDARRRTGLEDFGRPPLEPAFSVLVESLESDADLHPLGRFLIRMHLRALLETRLRLANYWRDKQQAMEAVAVERPVFIIGMPRSGSTFLHELLAEDPAHRTPRVWEVMFPVPGQNGDERDRQARIRKAEACLWWFRRLAPEADSVYPMRAQTPHECVAIQSYTFISQEFVSTCRVSRYEAFLAATDLLPAYEWQRRFLQHLHLQSPAKRWVLKSPDHVHGLEQLFAVFPDAVVIQTHRNPLEVVRSSTELTRVLQGLFGWRRDREEVAAREARILAAGTEKSMLFRDRHPELADRFLDVRYSDLVANPMGVVEWLYERLEAPLSRKVRDRIQALALKRSRYAGQRASALPPRRADQTGPEVVFQRYCSRFNLSWGDSG